MRFHVLSIPHTCANKEYVACAFTQKVIKFCKMLKSSKNQHTLYFYGHDKSEVPCDELIGVTNDEVLQRFYGKYEKNDFPKYGNTEAENLYSTNCIEEIGKRKQPNDFILCFWGWTQKVIADKFPDCIVVEPGIGYPASGTFSSYKVFESYAYMHYVYGKTNQELGKWYDCVIPNYFDPAEFEYKETKKDYMLYLGRIIKNKGLDICIQLANKLETKLIIAGQGDLKSLGYDEVFKYVECVGNADLEKRKELMSNARCLLLPTYYIEPFGGVVVEALMSGTPVITTDWGVFNETNLHGITGYRCRTFEQFVWAVKNIDKIQPKNCREWAISNFSMERVVELYEEYFDMLHKVFNGKGFYEDNYSRENLNWLYKQYPKLSN